MSIMDFTDGKVLPIDIEQEMRKSYMLYSMSTIVSRALPDVRDGLKPVHRKILYSMPPEAESRVAVGSPQLSLETSSELTIPWRRRPTTLSSEWLRTSRSDTRSSTGMGTSDPSTEIRRLPTNTRKSG